MNTTAALNEQGAAFRIGAAIVRSLRWGFLATLLLALLSFVPGLQMVPFCIFMASALLFSVTIGPLLPSTGGVEVEGWSLATAVILTLFAFAALRFVHLFFLHQLPQPNDRKA